MESAHTQRLARNNEIRDKLIEDMSKSETLNISKDEQTVLLKALSDSDKSAFNSQRIQIEEKNADSAAEQAKAFSNLSEQFSAGKNNPFLKRAELGQDVKPHIEASGKFEILDTTLNTTSSSQTAEQFTARRKAQEQEELSKRKGK